MAKLVEVDGVFQIRRGQELRLAELPSPRPDHLVRTQVTAVDDAERIKEFGAKLVRAPTVIGERCERTERRKLALVDAEVGLKSPDRYEHRRGHPKALLDPIEDRTVALEHDLALAQPVARDHAAGELL